MGKACRTIKRLCQHLDLTIPNVTLGKRKYDNSGRHAKAKAKTKVKVKEKDF
jgi:hypothetical protein